MFYEFLYPLGSEFLPFNVFKYITFRSFGGLLTGLFLYFLLGKFQIRLLQRWQVRQTIREDGPRSHYGKVGTPTMGGILILLCTSLSFLLWIDFSNHLAWLMLGLLLALGGIGFWDDWRKMRLGSSRGLPGRYKFLLQILVAGIVSLVLFQLTSVDTRLSLPFFKMIRPDLTLWYLPFAVFIIVGASNAVNLTDGLDGLATGPCILSFITFGILAYLAGHVKIAGYLQIPHIPGVWELTVFCSIVAGTLIGFLWFNTYPAEVFMGDVGSLPLGGALGLASVITKNEILLVIVGGVFVLEAISVITQVISFQMTGRRIFRMAPIHHHFELKGWAEPKVIVRFWIISLVLSLIALSTLKLR